MSSRIAHAARVAIAVAVVGVTVATNVMDATTPASHAKATAHAPQTRMAQQRTVHLCLMILRSPLMAHRLPTANTALKKIPIPVLSVTPVGQWIALDDATEINVIVANRRIQFVSGSAQPETTLRRVLMLKVCQSQWLLRQTSPRFLALTTPVNVTANDCTRCSRSRASALGATWRR